MTTRTGSLGLAVGIVVVEFAAAVTTFVAAALLPVITADLDARADLAVLVASSALGTFTALPAARRIVAAIGGRWALAIGVGGYVGGLGVAASAGAAWVFGVGQFTAGFAGGLLAVFGISSAIRLLDEAARVKVVAASSAMWILPALVVPAAALGAERLVGWRWALLLPVPLVVVGRVLMSRAARAAAEAEPHPVGLAPLMPVGVAGMLLAPGWWALPCAAVAVVGVAAVMPRGTLTLARGAPASLAAMTLFAVGYVGADSLITVLLTENYGASLGQAALVLSAAPLGWGLTSLAAPALVRRHGPRRYAVGGLAVAAAGVAVVAVSQAVPVALVAWAATGVGIGLAYPGLYLRATTGGGATALATAVITAEAFGGLLGRTWGGLGPLPVVYAAFAVALAAAAAAASR
ncbi:MFS transporter [Actinokineospora guangxiensis]|uniref:MFS transporter n=1 Tax=Actinokineospora guangxiensis TaxID=1490288 RepID=A0ABW0EYB3_9PSEU